MKNMSLQDRLRAELGSVGLAVVARLLRGATLGEIHSLGQLRATADLSDEAGAGDGKRKQRVKRRRWPVCANGDGGRYYPASGKKHLCYKCFKKAGGVHPSRKHAAKKAAKKQK